MEQPSPAVQEQIKEETQARREMSRSTIKRLKRMGKDELVGMIINMSNYAEAQKMRNIILENAMKDLETKLTTQAVESATKE